MKKFISLALAALWLTSPAALADGIKIVAAENFYGNVARQIGGTNTTVTSILTNPNQDPHDFTSSAQVAKEVADADIVIYNGISYDPWMDKLLANKGKSGRVAIKVSDLINAKEGDNPHIWYDPRTMPALATSLAKALIQSAASGTADSYQKRLADFNTSMKLVTDKIAEVKVSAAGLDVTATEPVFGYMADALGFKMLNYDFQLKIMNDAEPTADETAGFEKSLSSNTVKILFYNSQVSDPTTERMQQIARKAGIPIVGVTETQPLDQKDYVHWMLHELGAVQDALVVKSR